MNQTPKFTAGDYVYVQHQCKKEEFIDKNTGDITYGKQNVITDTYVVMDPCSFTDMKRIDGTPVEFYVMLRKITKDGAINKSEGYHQDNVRLLEKP